MKRSDKPKGQKGRDIWEEMKLRAKMICAYPKIPSKLILAKDHQRLGKSQVLSVQHINYFQIYSANNISNKT